MPWVDAAWEWFVMNKSWMRKLCVSESAKGAFAAAPARDKAARAQMYDKVIEAAVKQLANGKEEAVPDASPQKRAQ